MLSELTINRYEERLQSHRVEGVTSKGLKNHSTIVFEDKL